MFRKGLLVISLIMCLSFSALAEPIGIPDIERITIRTQSVSGGREAAGAAPELQTPVAETGGLPGFIRLPDGKLVPYGGGVICADDCVEDTEFLNSASRRPIIWMVTIPAVAGGVIAAVLGSNSSSSNPTRPTLFDVPNGTPNPGGTPTTTPNPDTAVPEPATIVLLGAGLALVARKVKRTDKAS
jgi:hypothetical protein